MKAKNYISILLTILALFSFTSTFANVAVNGSVTASSQDMPAANAIDGDDGSRWASTASDPQWLAVTLDAVYSIDNIKIHWEAANAASYTVKVSSDSSTWTTVQTKTDGTFGDRWDDIKFTSTDVKYIVMNGTVRSSEWGYSIWELQAFEEISEAQDASLSGISVNDIPLSTFNSNTKSYSYIVADGNVPTVTATPTITGANVNIIAATTIPGTTTIAVTATDEVTTDTFSVNFRAPVALPLDFESTTLTYNWTEFGAPTSVVDNPQSSGINTSSKVAQVIKNAGEDWNGSFITIDTPFDLSSGTSVEAKFFSPRAGINMMMKLESASGYATAEISVATTVANEWETLVFDFSGADVSQQLVKVVVICDRQTVGDGSADHTYLIDDIKLYDDGSTPLEQINLPVTFDNEAVNYTVSDFGGNGSNMVADPANDNNSVMMTTKPSTAETWAGTTIGTAGGFKDAVPFTATETTMSVKVYSPVVGSIIRLKAENSSDGALSVETDATTTVANAWETLVFDVANAVDGTPDYNESTVYNKVSLFFGFGSTGTEEVYYWDDVMFAGAASALINNTMETLNVYPNPTTGVLSIDAANGAMVSVYSLVGQLQQQSILEGGQISLNNLENGIYLVKINNQLTKVIKK